MSRSAMDTLTPMLRQYRSIKAQHPDAILLFRLGDFYEMFYDDALVASKALSLTLTSRGRGTKNEAPMCGVPYHAADSYVARLIRQGHRVAICDQVKAPRVARGIVRRAVTRVVSPGTVTDPAQLRASEPNYIAAIQATGVPERGGAGDGFGCAYLDLSTGDFRLSEHRGHSAGDSLAAQLALFRPREILHPEETSLENLVPVELLEGVLAHAVPGWTLGTEAASRLLNEILGTASLAGFGVEGRNLAVGAAGALLHYLQEAHKVEFLLDRQGERSALRARLANIHDLERLLARCSLGTASARDLVALRDSLAVLPEIAAFSMALTSPPLARIMAGFDGLADLHARLQESIADDPPATVREGGLLRDGYRQELDELRSIRRDSRAYLASIETRERERTGIASLKVRYNKVS